MCYVVALSLSMLQSGNKGWSVYKHRNGGRNNVHVYLGLYLINYAIKNGTENSRDLIE